MVKVLTRANTVNLAFVFRDENDDLANVASATCQLVFPGRDEFQQELLTLTQSGDAWITTWDSTASQGNWVRFHAHALSTGTPETSYVEDGRFKLSANLANYQHDRLPSSSNDLDDYPWR